jgi:hypothetical protein
MKARPGDYFGVKASRTLSLPTFNVTSKSKAVSKAAKSAIASNVDTLERVASESANRQRALKK